MDYLDQVALTRHGSFKAFEDWRRSARLSLVLLTTAAEPPTSTTPSATTRCCCSAVKAPACRRRCRRPPMPACGFPIAKGLRSLNVAMAVAMVAGEALRQTGGFGR